VIVADAARKREWEDKMKRQAFVPLRERVEFWDYERVSKIHALAPSVRRFEQTLMRNFLNHSEIYFRCRRDFAVAFADRLFVAQKFIATCGSGDIFFQACH
jgi:hypothetical protein